ncbi:ABC transporter permease [Mucilaginibacter sp. PAMB04274]|uniref:ABC transporter permease n=1 Tax=Mucilaginibacter sp. PAMB04274 TaxID=3138568 RepID=UPI0031F69257
MLKNYFRTAVRSLLKNKVFTLINIVGLAIGISAAIVIYLVVQYDFNFDKAHPNGDRIYRVVSNFNFQGMQGYNSGVPAPLGEAVASQVTGLAQAAPFFMYDYNTKVSITGSQPQPAVFKKQKQIILTDGSYFKLIKYKWLAGSANQSFKQPYKVVLTQSRAKLYFPNLNNASIIGKIITYNDSVKVTVSGIVEDLEQTTDFTFHDFISLATAIHNKNLLPNYYSHDWNNTSSSDQLMIKVSKNASVKQVEKQVNDIYYQNSANKKMSRTQSFALQPLADIHFNANYDNFDQRIANKKVLYGLLGVAAFLLILGCINFINLNTAQSAQRAKEIGIRKTIGGTRRQLIGQFLTETLLLTLAATLVSALLAGYLLQVFSDFIPADVTYAMMFTPRVFGFLVALIIIITLLSGLYPAMVMSDYQPIEIIKNQRGATAGKGNKHYLRKGLTVAQFVIAQFFVMGTLLVSSQIHYLLNKDLGFKKDALLYVQAPYSKMNTNLEQVFVNKLRAIPQISQISLGSEPPSSSSTMSTHMTYRDGKKETETVVYLKYGDQNFFNIYGLTLLAGRSPQMRDTSSGIVINETYAKELGFSKPDNVVGRYIESNGNHLQIVGVVKDFHQVSLRAPILPLALATNGQRNYNRVVHMALRFGTDGSKLWPKAIRQIEKAWNEVYPGEDFEYNFVDDTIANFYKAEQNTGRLLNWATGLSVFISCLGLLGLAIHTTSQRTKEIGIRKVMGATISQIVTILSFDFVKLIVLAFVIAMPIAWYALNQWLQSFAYHTSLSLWLFVGTIGVTISIALLTMSLQTVKAALVNPVKSLRSE